MKNLPYGLIALLISSSAVAQSKFYTEAGASYVALRGANYNIGANGTSSISASLIPGAPVPTSTTSLLNEDKSKWSPYIALGYNLSDQLGLRINYQYIGNLNASAKTSLLVGGDAVVGTVLLRFNDDVHVLSLAPEFKWPVTARLVFRLSPELNWVASRGEILASTTSPAIDIVPRRSRNEEKVTLGAGAGALWSLTEKCDLTISYKYADLKPSWSREAHFLSCALHWRF